MFIQMAKGQLFLILYQKLHQEIPTQQKFARKHVQAWVEASLVVIDHLAHKTSTFSGAQVSSD